MSVFDLVSARQRIGALEREVEQLQVQLAGCSTAAHGATADIAKQGDYGWSPAYQDVLELRQERDALVGYYGDLPER